ncbi:MAG: hypothetical protein ACREXX_15940 [Gammaproteobacteria bacterium]
MPERTTTDEILSVFNRVRNARLVGPEDLRVLGGRFPAWRLPQFIQLWGDALKEHLPSRIYEHVSRLRIERRAVAPPADLEALERARCFGPRGDLDVRRDGATIHWRLVGEAGVQWPDIAAAGFVVHDYWKGRPAHFRLRDLTAHTVQWRPNDDRVGGDWTGYGGLVAEVRQDDQRQVHHKILLRQRRYLRAGRQELVRFIAWVEKEYQQ